MAKRSWEEQYLYWEQLAARRRATYRLHLRMWMALGTFFPLLFAGMLVILALLLSAGIAYVSWKMVVTYLLPAHFAIYAAALPAGIVLALLYGSKQIVQSLFAPRIPPPAGVLLTRADAPRLFRIRDQMCQRMDTYPIEEVVITPEPNAAVVPWTAQTTFRRIRYSLVLGLPLMDILSPDQMRAVFAHELAHLLRSADETGLVAKAMRLYLFWQRMIELAEGDEEGAFVAPTMLRFYVWLLPRFDLLMQVARRQHEQHADKMAAAVGPPKAYAEALSLLELADKWLEQVFWRRMLEDELHRTINPFDNLRQTTSLNLQTSSPRRLLPYAGIRGNMRRYAPLTLHAR